MPGQIISRGERTWLVRVYLGRDPQTGKRRYEAQTVHGTKKDAQKRLTEVLGKLDKGAYAPGTARVLMNELLDDLFADYRINGLDKQGYEKQRCETHVRPFFGKILAAKLGTSDIRRYIEKRRIAETKANGRTYEPASNASINRELSLVRRALNLAAAHEPPKVARVPRFAMLAEDNVRKGFFEHEDFVRLRQALPEEMRPVVTFAYYTGCRRGEILVLVWSQVHLDERIVRLEPGETKNDQARTIPLAPELYEMLKLLKETRDQYYPESPWVFSRGGRVIKEFEHVWAPACKAAGLVDADGKPARLFHDLRRTGVRNLIRSGVSEKVAMMISGHKTRAVLDRYNIVDERDLKDAARKLGEYIARKDASPAAAHTNGTQEAPEAAPTRATDPAKSVN
jgi:integrase